MATQRAKKQTPASTSETLVSNYEDRLGVRQDRAKVMQEPVLPGRLTKTEVLGEFAIDPPGRQTSPEVASLAGRYLGIPKAERVKWVLAQSPEELARMLTALTASALGQVNE
jgi:hypothetical protein